jgi:adenosylhomocysteine nucleosidase
MTSTPIHLLVALPAEAKPLIRAFGLKRLPPDGEAPRYVKGALSLTLTGLGMEAAGSALASLYRQSEGHRRHWINLGIAGHARLEPGVCLLADEITDSHTGEQWRLNPIRDLPETTIGPLRSVREAETAFATTAGYDMESAAIARTLSKFGTLAKLQVLKVISDNPEHPSRHISGRMVSELIERQLPTLESLIARLQTHA